MLKAIVTKYIQKRKNNDFQFDENITSIFLFYFLFNKFIQLIRSLKFYYFKNRGILLFFGSNIHLFNKKNIKFGNNVNIGNNSRLSALGKAQLIIGNNVNIGAFSQVIISTSFNNIGEFIKIGSNVGIGEFSYIGGGGGTSIGNNTIIGQYLSIHPENHNYSDKSKLIREQGVSRQGVKIRSNCWIGAKVTILDGVLIGDNCVIAAGSVVTKSFPNNSLIGGVPARMLKRI